MLSTLKKCHNDYCEHILNLYLSEKISADKFRHMYYHTLRPLCINYEFEMPAHLTEIVEKLG